VNDVDDVHASDEKGEIGEEEEAQQYAQSSTP
jgi:hypothetical protein